MHVADLMSSPVQTVPPDATLKQVADTLVAHRISGLPVVDADGKVLGIVSEADILRKEKGADERPGGVLGWFFYESPDVQRKVAARLAGDAMTSPAVTVEPWQPAQRAAGLMVDHGVNRLPVVDEGKLVGIITRNDLLRAFVRSDAEIKCEILDDVVLRSLWIAPERVAVDVHDGDVKIGGQVDTELDAELVRRLVERIPGVVTVQTDFHWEAGAPSEKPWELPSRS